MRHISHCPKCNACLDAEDIYAHFLNKYEDEDRALEAASWYGWTKENLCCFSRLIGVYDMNEDRTVYYVCPDCKEKISRKDGDGA